MAISWEKQVVTANRLRDGTVVYLDSEDGWSERIEAARVAGDDEAGADLLARSETPAQALKVVGPYLMEVTETDGRITPVGVREIIRARGPSVGTDIGEPGLGTPAREK